MVTGWTHIHMVTDWRAFLGALAVPLAPVVFTLGAIQEPQDCGAWWRWWRRRACVRASGGGGERPSAQSAMQTTRRGLSPLSARRAMLRGLNCTREGTEPALRWRLSEGNSPALRCASQVGAAGEQQGRNVVEGLHACSGAAAGGTHSSSTSSPGRPQRARHAAGQ